MPDSARHLDSVVRVTGRDSNAQGTGFVIWHQDAATYVVTCHHVVEDTAAQDGRRTVLIDGHEARPRYESPTGDPDLSVLVCEAPELRTRPALKLGRVAQYREGWVAGYFRFSNDQEAEKRAFRFPIRSHLDNPELLIQHGPDVRIITGNSGSPVLDNEFECVIAVIASTPRQDRRGVDSEDTVVKAIPIHRLKQVWPDLPAELFFEFEDADQVRIAPALRHGLERIGFIRLRVLLAASGPSEVGDVNAELATVKEALHRVGARLRQHVALDLYECVGADRMRAVGTPASDARVLPGLPLHEFDLVVLIAWHNLGGDGLDLHELARTARQAAQSRGGRRPAQWCYHREDGPRVDLDDPRRPEWLAHRERVQSLVRSLYEQRAKVRLYRGEKFRSLFLEDLGQFLEDAIAEASRGAAPTAPAGGPPPAPGGDNPYVGLRAYREGDAARFFGRTDEVDQLCALVGDERRRLLAVVGASGSGKSSLVRAGLVPRLKWDAIPGSGRWVIIDFSLARHGRDPLFGLAGTMRELMTAAAQNRYPRAEHVERDLRDPARLEALADAVLTAAGGSGRVVVLVDQFEELFTLGPEETGRDPGATGERAAQVGRFARFLADAADSRRFLVLITLRADYYDRVLELAPLAGALREGVYSVPALQSRALLAMITGPAVFAGLRFDDGALPFEILRDAGTEAGALPLVSYALEQLADPGQRSGSVITRAAYARLGGVNGLIQRKADDVLEDLRRRMRDADLERFDLDAALGLLFRRLVRVDEEGRAAKCVARLSPTDLASTPGVRLLVEDLVNQRLLQTGAHPAGGGPPTVELAHEALLTHWRQLREWILSKREALLALRRVEVSAREWRAARDRAPDAMAALAVDRARLWPDALLREFARALALLDMPVGELEATVQEFIRPEADRLGEELRLAIGHARRADIGDRLAELGDARPGVGLRADGLPDIVWCPVPAGTVRIATVAQPIAVDAFSIAMYPVTLAQFNVFAQGPTYLEEQWWEGLPVRPAGHPPVRQTPRVSNHPAQFVSWYQAVAYCRWLSAALGYAVRLPTEAEWQQAASGGDPDRLYPWGREWAPARANTREDGEDRLVSVGLYPEGASPVGALDMSGNVYEWCQNEFDDVTRTESAGDRPRTTRGGAYFTLEGQEAREAVTVTARVRDSASGYRDRTRIRAGIRLASDHPHKGGRQDAGAAHPAGR